MESEIRDAVNTTGGTALAAIGVGFVLTLILPYTAEDILALSISFLIGQSSLARVYKCDLKCEIFNRIRCSAKSASETRGNQNADSEVGRWDRDRTGEDSGRAFSLIYG